MKIFVDVRTWYWSCKVVIIYYSNLIHFLNISNPKIIELAIGIVLRKLKFLISDIQTNEEIIQSYGISLEN